MAIKQNRSIKVVLSRWKCKKKQMKEAPEHWLSSTKEMDFFSYIYTKMWSIHTFSSLNLVSLANKTKKNGDVFEVGHICEAKRGGNYLTWQMVQSETAK